MKSYSGEYNSHYLRSSYEYIFAKILEKQNIKYDVETITYELEDRSYTPDFFIYDDNDKLIEIVEIRGYKLDIQERIKDTQELQSFLGDNVKVSLITDLDMKRICKNNNLSFYKLEKEWKDNANSSTDGFAGSRNPMYNRVHSEETRKLISKGVKKKCEDPNHVKKVVAGMLEYCRATNYDFLRGERVDRVTLICPICGKGKQVLPSEAKKRIFCSRKCAHIDQAEKQKGTKKASTTERNIELKKFILSWCDNNKDIVVKTKFNQVLTCLEDLFNKVEKEFGILDFRTVINAFDTNSKKEFLKILKAHVSE